MANKAKNDMPANSTHKSARGKDSVSRSSSSLDKYCGEEQRARRTKIQSLNPKFYLLHQVSKCARAGNRHRHQNRSLDWARNGTKHNAQALGALIVLTKPDSVQVCTCKVRYDLYKRTRNMQTTKTESDATNKKKKNGVANPTDEAVCKAENDENHGRR
ncbi:unnamed protein product [Phytophthora lilii]|uniref:Unnamed protein product n=1 Tax=Phytophthora lilii TaxID=2077276 RepID=A0A9W6THS6_9STRA|nr:unnamed protein product [Phytophthora lilii]